MPPSNVTPPAALPVAFPPELVESSGGLELPSELRGLELDPQQAALRKAQRLRRLHSVAIPALRFVGFGTLSLGIYLYLRFFAHQDDAGRVALLYAGVAFSYCLLAAVVLRVFYERLARIQLAMVFLAVDVLLHIVAIYVTGAAARLRDATRRSAPGSRRR